MMIILFHESVIKIHLIIWMNHEILLRKKPKQINDQFKKFKKISKENAVGNFFEMS